MQIKYSYLSGRIALLVGSLFLLPGSSACSQSLTIDSIVISTGSHLYYSPGNIVSPDTLTKPVLLTGNARVDYKAAHYVKLKPGFKTSLSTGGGKFHAYTGLQPDGCPTAIITGEHSMCGSGMLSAASSTSGTGTITSYQWQRNGIDLTGETGVTHSASQSGDYTVVISNTNHCTVSSFIFTVTVLPCGVVMNLKMFIQGYYRGGGQMTPAIYNQDQVQGGAIGNTPDQVDTVIIEAIDPVIFAVADRIKAILQTDGSLSGIFKNVQANNRYYAAIRHRCGIYTCTANPVTFSAVTNYDFTTNVDSAYGSNMVDVFNENVWSFYSGDMNQDGYVDVFDYPIFEADNFEQVSGYFQQNPHPPDLSGYPGLFLDPNGYSLIVLSDLNGDGFVDVFDYPIFEQNSFNQVQAISPH